MKYIIIEDEDHGAELLYTLVSKSFPQLTFSGRARGLPDGIALIKQENPDILFLDIEIEKGSGFDVLDNTQLPNTLVIFTTGYNEFAIRAIRYGAYDYLLKPIQLDELTNAISKAIKVIKNGQLQTQNYINPITDNFQNVVFSYKNERILVKPFDILVVNASGKYSNIQIKGGINVLSSYNIGYYESLLPGEIFIRIHNSSLINKLHLSHIDVKNYTAILKDGQRVNISKRKLKEVIALI